MGTCSGNITRTTPTVDTRGQALERQTQEHLATNGVPSGSWPRTDRSGTFVATFHASGHCGRQVCKYDLHSLIHRKQLFTKRLCKEGFSIHAIAPA